MKPVEGMEKLLLGALFARDELDVIHQQQIKAAQARFEFDHLIGFECLHEFDHEPLSAAVENTRARVRAEILVADRMQQVCLALAGCGGYIAGDEKEIEEDIKKILE